MLVVVDDCLEHSRMDKWLVGESRYENPILQLHRTYYASGANDLSSELNVFVTLERVIKPLDVAAFRAQPTWIQNRFLSFFFCSSCVVFRISAKYIYIHRRYTVVKDGRGGSMLNRSGMELGAEVAGCFRCDFAWRK